jgi:hypothetical protein
MPDPSTLDAASKVRKRMTQRLAAGLESLAAYNGASTALVG